ncbi:hypothetical protein KC318_g37 [Hortaea werneckii]|nr:hypothetical protein KC334_g34 [Hortaea werneckii]KAI7028358.1 hypothetical protein KC355_g37 [Hortaea werneckii]KAI7676814.1 hypothetical protein KC318_g37 [Hortaea werneckii]
MPLKRKASSCNAQHCTSCCHTTVPGLIRLEMNNVHVGSCKKMHLALSDNKSQASPILDSLLRCASSVSEIAIK